MIKEKYIRLLDIIYNTKYEDVSCKEKWDIFDKISSEIENFTLEDFTDESLKFLEKGKGIDKGIVGAIRISNDFPDFSENGLNYYYAIKLEQLKNVFYEHDYLNEKEINIIFGNLNVQATKHILNYCLDKKIISKNGNIYENGKINFDRIVPFKDDNITYINVINNSGTMTNVSQTINYNDTQLYNTILSKIELIRNELGDNYNSKIDDLINAINNKNKKSVLTILSELSSIGSLVATGIMAFINQ